MSGQGYESGALSTHLFGEGILLRMILTRHFLLRYIVQIFISTCYKFKARLQALSGYVSHALTVTKTFENDKTSSHYQDLLGYGQNYRRTVEK